VIDELAAKRSRKENRKRARRGPVTVEQVVAYAWKACPDCAGLGLVAREDGAVMEAGVDVQEVCDCAERRFQQLHADLLVVTADGLAWK
jgi:hypothetical protein